MTTQPESDRIARLLSGRFGLALSVTGGKSAEGDYVDIRPSDLQAKEGFAVRTLLGWRHVRAEVRCESFAGDLLAHMAQADAEQRAQFSDLAKLLAERGGRISMAVAGVPIDPRQPCTWPDTWGSLSLFVERTPLLIDHHDPSSVEAVVAFWGGGLLGMVVALLTVEEAVNEGSLELRGLPEGARQRIEVNRYERNRINRALCIARHGTACSVCQFDFESVYGETGEDFTHVHHVVPISKIGTDYVIDPAADLIPVCPNCHAMLHRRDPPFTVEEMRARMSECAKAKGSHSG